MSHGVAHAQVVGSGGDIEPEIPPVWGDPEDQTTDNGANDYAVGLLATGDNIYVYASNLPEGFVYNHPNLSTVAGIAEDTYVIEDMIFAWNSGNDPIPCGTFTWTVTEGGVLITQQPQDSTVDVPQGTTFSVEATHSGGAPLYYRWQAREPGGQWLSPSIVLSDVVVPSINLPTLVVRSTSVEGNPITAPTIDVQPQDSTVTSPQGASFVVSASHEYDASLFYRWEARRDGGPWSDPREVLSNVVGITVNLPILIINSTET